MEQLETRIAEARDSGNSSREQGQGQGQEELRRLKAQIKQLSDQMTHMQSANTSAYMNSTSQDAEDIKTLRRKLKELGESTSQVCKSLSAGLNDVQETNLNLFVWGDKVHGAMGALAARAGMAANPCPKVPLQRGNSGGGGKKTVGI